MALEALSIKLDSAFVLSIRAENELRQSLRIATIKNVCTQENAYKTHGEKNCLKKLHLNDPFLLSCLCYIKNVIFSFAFNLGIF